MTNKQEAKVLSLSDIVQFEIEPLLRRQHLNRDVIIGFIGERGDGKSLGGAVLTIIDYMLQGEPCYSNMRIAVEFVIDDSTASKYGLEGGIARFESMELDKHKFLTFAPEYHDGVFFIDEENLWLGDARRAMSNENLAAADVGQQLRKLRSAIIFTCIHEMFVESRIRDATDIFIKTSDTALSPLGLARKMPQGIKFEWIIYPMSRKLTGRSYSETQKPLPPVSFYGKPWWGTFNTWERQHRKKYKAPVTEGISANLEITENTSVVETRGRWDWLEEKILMLKAAGTTEISSSDLWQHLELRSRGISVHQVQGVLGFFGLVKPDSRKSVYKISNFSLDAVVGEKAKKRATPVASR